MRSEIDLDEVRGHWEAHHAAFPEFLNMRLESLAPGEAVMRLPFRIELTNGAGAIHGGAIASLCDTAFYVALATIYGWREPTVTTGMTCNYLAAARPPHDLVAHAKILRPGKRMVFGEVTVHAGETLVAHATLTYLNVGNA